MSCSFTLFITFKDFTAKSIINRFYPLAVTQVQQLLLTAEAKPFAFSSLSQLLLSAGLANPTFLLKAANEENTIMGRKLGNHGGSETSVLHPQLSCSQF